MKIQNLALVFLIIAVPLFMVLTFYNQLQVNNLTLQLKYNTKLSDATHDAVKAFQLNTVNNKYSQVADSLKRDVEASINVFLTSLAKNLGISGETTKGISEYIPAVVFTLYDGYYIYSPSYVEELKEVKKEAITIDGEKVEIIEEESQEPKVKNYEHILKPYIYYTIRYNPTPNTDFIVNYSLDNYISIYGEVADKYVTKSGYLIVPEDVEVTVDKDRLFVVLARDILEYILPPRTLDNKTDAEIKKIFDNTDIINVLNKKQDNGKDNIYKTSLISNMGEELLNKAMQGEAVFKAVSNDKILEYIPVAKIDEKFTKPEKHIITTTGIINEVLDCVNVKYKTTFEINDIDGKSYYTKALKFTNWVNTNLSQVKALDARDSKGNEYDVFKNNNTYVFNTKKTESNNPEELTSKFTQHKIEVIKSSIQANLNSAIARYNQSYFEQVKEYSIKMPILNELEWEAITNKVTMVTFMQGMNVGNKIFNDYCIVSSAKNKELIDPNEMYYFNKNATGIVYYHKLDCPELDKEKNSELVGYKSIDFDVYKTKDESGQIIYSYGAEIEKIKKAQNENKITELSACYHCLVDKNYRSVPTLNAQKLNAKYLAVSRERNKFYKVNEYLDSVY